MDIEIDPPPPPPPPLACGLPYEVFMKLRAGTPLGRGNLAECQVVFDKLYALGFKVVPRQD